jgi:hypothetical protein
MRQPLLIVFVACAGLAGTTVAQATPHRAPVGSSRSSRYVVVRDVVLGDSGSIVIPPTVQVTPQTTDDCAGDGGTSGCIVIPAPVLPASVPAPPCAGTTASGVQERQIIGPACPGTPIPAEGDCGPPQSATGTSARQIIGWSCDTEQDISPR